MATRELTIGDLHNHLVAQGFVFGHLSEKGGVVTVHWDKNTPNPAAQAEIDGFEWIVQYESDKEKLLRIEADVELLKGP